MKTEQRGAKGLPAEDASRPQTPRETWGRVPSRTGLASASSLQPPAPGAGRTASGASAPSGLRCYRSYRKRMPVPLRPAMAAAPPQARLVHGNPPGSPTPALRSGIREVSTGALRAEVGRRGPPTGKKCWLTQHKARGASCGRWRSPDCTHCPSTPSCHSLKTHRPPDAGAPLCPEECLPGWLGIAGTRFQPEGSTV